MAEECAALSEWLEASFLVVMGALWLAGLVLADIDYARKRDALHAHWPDNEERDGRD